MFTGLIKEFATVISYQNNYLTLSAKYKPNIGDSVAVNGVCLTVVTLGSGVFTVELSAETREIIAVENLTGKVHIEPAMAMGDRIEGHIVQGHADCIGMITSITKNQNATDMKISIPDEFKKFVIPKGSIAIDGVSLTVNDVSDDEFRLTIVSYTLEKTIFREYKVGRRINIETDMFARYVYHMFKDKKSTDWDSIDKMMSLY